MRSITGEKCHKKISIGQPTISSSVPLVTAIKGKREHFRAVSYTHLTSHNIHYRLTTVHGFACSYTSELSGQLSSLSWCSSLTYTIYFLLFIFNFSFLFDLHFQFLIVFYIFLVFVCICTFIFVLFTGLATLIAISASCQVND